MGDRRSHAVLAVVLFLGTLLAGLARAAEPTPAPRNLIDEMRQRILASLGAKPGMVVADIGIGGGWFLLQVAEMIGPDGVIYGTDIDQTAIDKVQKRIPELTAKAGKVELRLCKEGRDTALEDLPADRVDLIMMIDSLCFDAAEPRQRNVDYLRGFLRVLKPGGRLVHHMDCRCDVTTEAVTGLFREAGFSAEIETLDVAPDPATIESDWPCRSEAERKRHAYVAVFRKPEPSAK